MKDSQAESQAPSTPHPGTLDRALQLVKFLRSRCPWDAAQTPETLRRYLLEEVLEVIGAISAGDDTALADELGDLLFNLAYQVVLGEERAAFTRDEVVERLESKMRRRHPELYGGGDSRGWAESKALEANSPIVGAESILDDLAPALDLLQQAHELQAAAALVGFDWPSTDGALEKVREEVMEVADELGGLDAGRVEEEIGDLLFSVVNLARLSGTHAPTAMAAANAKFNRRFRAVEVLARERQIAVEAAGLEALDKLWGEVKEAER